MPVEFIVGAAVGAVVASTRVRRVVRRGLIYGVGGVLVAYDKVAAMAQGARQSVRDAAAAPATTEPAATAPAAPAPDAPVRVVAVDASSPAGTPS